MSNNLKFTLTIRVNRDDSGETSWDIETSPQIPKIEQDARFGIMANVVLSGENKSGEVTYNLGVKDGKPKTASKQHNINILYPKELQGLADKGFQLLCDAEQLILLLTEGPSFDNELKALTDQVIKTPALLGTRIKVQVGERSKFEVCDCGEHLYTTEVKELDPEELIKKGPKAFLQMLQNMIQGAGEISPEDPQFTSLFFFIPQGPDDNSPMKDYIERKLGEVLLERLKEKVRQVIQEKDAAIGREAKQLVQLIEQGLEEADSATNQLEEIVAELSKNGLEISIGQARASLREVPMSSLGANNDEEDDLID